MCIFVVAIGKGTEHMKKPVREELPRDAFDDGELIKLISLPLFTGCANAFRVFKPGKYFLQSHVYWGYLILILTGSCRKRSSLAGTYPLLE